MLLLRRKHRSSNNPSQTDRAVQTVLITGVSSGIGKVTALLLAERGHKVIGTGRSMERMRNLRDEATERRFAISVVELDINSDEDCRTKLPDILEKHGPVDALVNNAGYGLWGPVETLSIDELRAQFETNLFAAFRLTKAVLPGMADRRYGKIVNVSSILGRMGTPFNGAYVASKFALEGLSEALRAEVAPLGIKVSLVEPGLYRTEFQSNQVIARDARTHDGVYASYIRNYNENHDKYQLLMSDPIAVAKVIRNIVEAKNPAFRYAVGIEARMGIMGRRYLPERLFHAMLSRATVK